jgi:hypothetical protein
LGFFGQTILKVVPPAPLVPIGGIGIASGLEQIRTVLPRQWSDTRQLCGYFGLVRWHQDWLRQIPSPEAPHGYHCRHDSWLGDVPGTISSPEEASKLVKWWGPVWTADELFQDFEVKDYLGIVVPIGISAAATSLMCLVSAKGGDGFSGPREHDSDAGWNHDCVLFRW